MKNVNIQQTNNGFLVELSSAKFNSPVPFDFTETMSKVAKEMTKSMNQDSLLSDLKDKNKQPDPNALKDGLYVFKTYSEMEGFIKLVIGE